MWYVLDGTYFRGVDRIQLVHFGAKDEARVVQEANSRVDGPTTWWKVSSEADPRDLLYAANSCGGTPKACSLPSSTSWALLAGDVFQSETTRAIHAAAAAAAANGIGTR